MSDKNLISPEILKLVMEAGITAITAIDNLPKDKHNPKSDVLAMMIAAISLNLAGNAFTKENFLKTCETLYEHMIVQNSYTLN